MPMPPFEKKLSDAGNRSEEIPERFTQASTQASIRADLNLIDAYDAQIAEVERTVLKNAKINDPVTLKLLRTIPGIGKILSLVLLYEIDQIARFPEVGNFLSYSRLVRCEHESASATTILARNAEARRPKRGRSMFTTSTTTRRTTARRT